MKRILVIEDDIDLLQAMASVLRMHGYAVYQAENGQTGVELARAHLPDLITCDMNMPGFNGRKVIETLAQYPSTAGIPFLFITAGEPMTFNGTVQCHYRFMRKPFDIATLLATIHEYVTV